MPGEAGRVVVSPVMHEAIALGHDQLEIALPAVRALDQRRIPGDAGHRLAVGADREWTIPLFRGGVVIIEDEPAALLVRVDHRRDPGDHLEIARTAEVALD